MARYKISITLDLNPLHEDILVIDDGNVTTYFDFEFWRDVGDPEVPDSVLVETSFPIEDDNISTTTYNLYTNLIARYNLGGAYTVERNGNVINITGEFAVAPELNPASSPKITFAVKLINNPIHIEAISIEKNIADTCNYFDVVVHGSHEFNQLLRPRIETFTDTLNHTIDGLGRGRTYLIEIKDSDGEEASTTIELPSFLNLGMIDVVVANNQVIVNDWTKDLTLEYSLDNSNWQTENVFSGLSGGDYQLYIRDQYDCQIQTTFTLDTGVNGVITIPEPFFYYPKSNCLRMAVREQWDEITVHKNSSNTLSCEVIDNVKYSEKQRYRSEDVIPIQIKTNYSDLKVITSDDDVEQTIVQKSANMGIKSSMDCKITDLGDNQIGVYFIAGKTYNYDTGDDLLEDYALNGQLPQFAKVGNIITINNFNYTIQELTFNQDLEVDQIIISSSTLTDGDYIIKAVYNVFNYEIYEVDIDCSLREEFNVEVWYDGAIQRASEIILIDNVSENLIKLKWSHRNNTDMFFATGIEPFVRLLVDTIKATPKNESENYETDIDVSQIDTNNYEADVFKFLPLTKEVAKLVLLGLSHSNIELRGLEYVKDGSPELEALDYSNLYVVTATMLLKGSGLYKEEVDVSNTEIPTLLQTDLDEYIKIG